MEPERRKQKYYDIQPAIAKIKKGVKVRAADEKLISYFEKAFGLPFEGKENRVNTIDFIKKYGIHNTRLIASQSKFISKEGMVDMAKKAAKLAKAVEKVKKNGGIPSNKLYERAIIFESLYEPKATRVDKVRELAKAAREYYLEARRQHTRASSLGTGVVAGKLRTYTEMADYFKSIEDFPETTVNAVGHFSSLKTGKRIVLR